MRLLRDETIRGSETADPPRQPWSRKYTNEQVKRLRQLFEWAAAQQLAPVIVYQSCGGPPFCGPQPERTAIQKHARKPHRSLAVRFCCEPWLAGIRRGLWCFGNPGMFFDKSIREIGLPLAGL
ncbi:MAG TPA: hypothetical protein PLL20_20495, partial [Phycisphaerae bacterium]|nr:hypothetical protein [Phycisphaerae bacterium]HRR86806.1 hypothetical protein [Phycisphaerae bacterium]